MNLEPGVLQVNLDDIIPNRFQPRIAFDEQGLKELADSIKEHGIIQPLVLRKLGNKYEIIAGERRYKAATMAGLVTVPAVISNIDDNKSAEVALVENIQRRDLTPIEEAKSYKQLLDRGYLTQEQLAKRMGVSQSSVSNKLRLLNLDTEVQEALLSEKISERHARSLLQLTDKEEQKKWLAKTINERLTVRQLDQEIKKVLASSDNQDTIPKVELAPSIEEIKSNAEDIIKPQVNTEIEQLFPTNPVVNTPINNNPIVMDIPKEPEEVIPSPVSSSNKFFNFMDENAPANMDVEPMDIPVSRPNTIEIIDTPAPTPPVEEPTPVVEPEPIPEPEILNTDFDRNPNNKFFTPVIDTRESVPEILQRPEEVVVDPMSQIDRIDPQAQAVTEAKKELELMDAVNDIRDMIKKFGDEGFNINVEEMDLEGSYQININIEKQ